MTSAESSTRQSPDGRFRLGLVGRDGWGGRTSEHCPAPPESSSPASPRPSAEARSLLPEGPRASPSSTTSSAKVPPRRRARRRPDRPAPRRMFRKLMDARLPVLCEKPCGLTVEETKECAQAAEERTASCRWRTGVVSFPSYRTCSARIRAGELGEILAVNCYQWDVFPATGGVPRQQRRDIRRHGRPRVRPGALAHRAGVRQGQSRRFPDPAAPPAVTPIAPSS